MLQTQPASRTDLQVFTEGGVVGVATREEAINLSIRGLLRGFWIVAPRKHRDGAAHTTERDVVRLHGFLQALQRHIQCHCVLDRRLTTFPTQDRRSGYP